MSFRPGQLIIQRNNIKNLVGYRPEPMKLYMSRREGDETGMTSDDFFDLERVPVMFLGIAYESFINHDGWKTPRWIDVLYRDQRLVVNETKFEELFRDRARGLALNFGKPEVLVLKSKAFCLAC